MLQQKRMRRPQLVDTMYRVKLRWGLMQRHISATIEIAEALSNRVVLIS